MRCGKLYLDDVAECQGELFVEAVDNGYDIESFTKYYMQTRIRELIDLGYPLYCTMLGHEIFEFLQTKESIAVDRVKRAGINTAQSGFMAEWLGVFYARAQWFCDISSVQLLRLAPVDDLICRYNALHGLDIDLAVERYCKTRMKDIICFHNPDEPNGYLSNWYMSDFVIRGVSYSSMEQYMMYSKAILFKDIEIAKQILRTKDVREIKALGRQVRNFDEDTWVSNREEIITKGLLAKFSQSSVLRDKLLKTGDSMLAECAVKDKIWGIGLSMKDSNRFDTRRWSGLNLLGKCLMDVREKINLLEV